MKIASQFLICRDAINAAHEPGLRDIFKWSKLTTTYRLERFLYFLDDFAWGDRLVGFLDDALAYALTESLIKLRDKSPDSYQQVKSSIEATSAVLAKLSSSLKDDKIDANEIEDVLSTIKDKGAYRASISVLTSILGHVKAK